MKTYRYIYLINVVLYILVFNACKPTERVDTIISNVNVIDVVEGRVIKGQDVIIEGTNIKRIMPHGGFFKKNVDSAFHRIVSILEGASHIGWRESLAGSIEWQNEHCTNTIKSVKAPIIAINSDMQPTNVEVFRKYAPTFKAKIVEDVGHLIMWDNTKKFNWLLEESIQEFIGE